MAQGVVDQGEDSVFNVSVGLVRELHRVKLVFQGLGKMFLDHLFHDLRSGRGECNRSEVIEFFGILFLWYRHDVCSFPQGWDVAFFEGSVEEATKDRGEFVGACFQHES